MDTQFIVTKALPLTLAFIMFGMGLNLSTKDFSRVVSFPKPVILGLLIQMVLLPIVAFGLCHLFALPAPFAIGLMLLAASPGGVTANIFSHLSHGDVALNLTLTAINSVIAAFSLPLITEFAIRAFSAQDTGIGLQLTKMLEVFAIVILPVAAGMWVRSKAPAFSQRMDRPVRIFSFVVLLAVVITAISKEWAMLTDHLAEVGWAVLIFNLLSLGAGYVLPVALKIPRKQAIAISFEIGIHNGTLAIFVAASVLGSYSFAVPAAAYSILMFFTAAIFSFFVSRRAEIEITPS
jgi:BASS family bile acid:Na+ symporter